MNLPAQTDPVLAVRPAEGTWEAAYRRDRLSGPQALRAGGAELLSGCDLYLDDLTEASAVVADCRATRRSGALVVSTRGYFPFGGQVAFRQQAVHHGNRVQLTLDVTWPPQQRLRRHLGIGTLRLPGRWQRLFVVPPAAHLAGGQVPAWQELPEPAAEPVMAAHWHRPPLALVLARADGACLEVGTGSDVWRWEQSLGFGPESGSYKLFVAADGLRLVREPLMCCTEFVPAHRVYRFTWYLAWSPPGAPPAAAARPADAVLLRPGLERLPPLNAKPAVEIELAGEAMRPGWFRAPSELALGRGERTPALCLEENAVQKRLRHLMRQIAATRVGEGRLHLCGLAPGVCWDPAHVAKPNYPSAAHWDINGLFDVAAWAQHTLGPGWRLSADVPPPWDELPSLRGLFQPATFPPAALDEAPAEEA